METIYDLKKRAKELSEKNEVNSVSPVEVGNLIDDTLNIIDEYNKNVVGLGIRKTYSSIASMQADGTDPVGNDGKPIRFGQLVSVYDESNPDSEENGGVYAFQSPGWKLATTTAINVVSEYGDSEIEVISQKFFSDNVQHVVSGRIDIGNGMSVLDEYNSPAKCGWYVLTLNGMPAYHLLITSDSMRHVVTQFIYGNSVINEDGEIESHQDYSTTILTRTYNINAPMLPDIPARTWGKWMYLQDTFLKSEFGASVTDAVTQKFFTEQTKDRVLGIVDLANIDTLNNLKSLGYYHVYSGKKPMHELIVASDSMHHTIIQYMFSNYTAENGELNTHQDSIATIIYRIYNLNAPNEETRHTWSKWRQYGQNFEVLSETEYAGLKKWDSEMFYYTFEDEV